MYLPPPFFFDVLYENIIILNVQNIKKEGGVAEEFRLFGVLEDQSSLPPLIPI